MNNLKATKVNAFETRKPNPSAFETPKGIDTKTIDDFFNIQIPFDITIGHGTHKAGTTLRTLIRRMQALEALVPKTYFRNEHRS